MTTRAPFRLSAELAGHGSDVRALASAGAVLFSSSRDGSARSWVPSADGWSAGQVYSGQHDGFVNAVAWARSARDDATEGLLVTAGQDKLIHVWPLVSHAASDAPGTPSHTLIGHESNVCALNVSTDGARIVSGSWDKTAKVWSTDDFSLTHTLTGHDQAVWAVLALDGDDDRVLTGAADNLVKLWKGDKVTFTFKGHTQAVRALAKLGPGVGGGNLFASAGNDATVRLWNLDGEAVTVLSGHDSFVYSLSPIPDSAGGGLISGGEDRTVRVWRAADGECEQTIVIPAVSVWAVACLPNGDIAAGSSDGIVRVFSRDDARIADVEMLTAYDHQVSNTALNPSQVGDVKKNDLPGPEALDNPGKKEGQVIMVKNDAGSVEAHQWSVSSRSWAKIGEVVDAVGSSRKQLYMGQEYDHVFDVDFKDGVPPLKLPYNTTDNPYEAAQKFLCANDMAQEYIDEVVKFIEANTGGATLGTGSSEFVDPYTGASRYTGGGAGSTPAPQNSGFSGDPYTGGGRSTSSASDLPSLLPHRKFLSFAQANLPALRTKLGQLNDELSADPSTAELALTAEEALALDKLIAFLLATTATTTSKKVKLGDAESAVALKLLEWPSAQRFPGLDLIRLLSLVSPLSDSIPSLLGVAHTTSGPSKEVETNTMLTFRALANVFVTHYGKGLMKDEAEEIVDVLVRRGTAGVSKNAKVALSTVVLNYSVLATTGDITASTGANLFDLITELLRDVDGEVVYRSLIALGNLLLSPHVTASIPAAGLERYKTLAREAARRLPEARIKAVLVEIARK